MKLKCPKCENSKIFYREISIVAKQKVNNEGEDLRTIYDIDKSHVDDDYYTVYCGKCSAAVKKADT